MYYAQDRHPQRGAIGRRAYTGRRSSRRIDLCRHRKTEDSKGITIDDLGQGLKIAAQNVEKEIPKMGSAI
jgi:hypothetical protein